MQALGPIVASIAVSYFAWKNYQLSERERKDGLHQHQVQVYHIVAEHSSAYSKHMMDYVFSKLPVEVNGLGLDGDERKPPRHYFDEAGKALKRLRSIVHGGVRVYFPPTVALEVELALEEITREYEANRAGASKVTLRQTGLESVLMDEMRMYK